ncbi:T9SS type A sorting domain-containing protein [Fluviicola taffensis]|uniref:poly(ethylene terephthalate) hydrolase family protein n=1 Tax=Fluviicola taffensis TaxID=191579 RepID=UPI003137E661
MKTTLLLLFVFMLNYGFSQPFQIGHKTITFNDPGRTGGFGSGGGAGRQIQCEIYYPSATAGNDVTISSGQFPFAVFGHGFVMTWDSYQNFIDHYVPLGYVLVFPRTEGGFSPVHQDFALDLLVAGTRMEALHSDVSSFFYQAWNGKKAVMGHSMGGGSSFLAAAQNTANFDILVGFAPAETTPSAIDVSSTISIPTLVFSGTEDAVTTPVSNHKPMYDSVSNVCKHFISITGGAHCYFANSSTTCDFGESASGGNISITRPVQHDITFDALDPYLKFYLMKDCLSWPVFTTQRDTDTRIQSLSSCSYSLPSNPTITQNGSVLSIPSTALTISWYLNGVVLNGEQSNSIDTQQYGNGTYEVRVSDASVCYGSTSQVITNGTNGLNESVETLFTVYPNPTNGLVTIQTTSLNPQAFELSDIGGRIINRFEVQLKSQISIENLKSGTYFIRSVDSNQLFRIIKN